MNLVTVTCLKDFNQMRLQAESIQRFLEPCTHYVIVNDEYIDKRLWSNMLAPYYTNHKLILLFPDWYMYGHSSGIHSGWMKHQVHKLIISEQLDDDYIALDSKNFFIKHCSLEDWRDIIGSGRIENNKEEYDKWVRSTVLYAEYFNFSLLEQHHMLASETPFVFKVEVLAKLSNMQQLFTDLYWNNGTGNECILYSYLIRDQLPDTLLPPRHLTWWRCNKPITNQELIDVASNRELLVFGIHREFIQEADIHSIQLLNGWLNSLGLTTKINDSVQETQI